MSLARELPRGIGPERLSEPPDPVDRRFIPGSAADITARVLGQRMGQILGQQFVIEAKPGAGSSLAAEFVARAATTATRSSSRRPPISPTGRSIPTSRSI